MIVLFKQETFLHPIFIYLLYIQLCICMICNSLYEDVVQRKMVGDHDHYDCRYEKTRKPDCWRTFSFQRPINRPTNKQTNKNAVEERVDRMVPFMKKKTIRRGFLNTFPIHGQHIPCFSILNVIVCTLLFNLWYLSAIVNFRLFINVRWRRIVSRRPVRVYSPVIFIDFWNEN